MVLYSACAKHPWSESSNAAQVAFPGKPPARLPGATDSAAQQGPGPVPPTRRHLAATGSGLVGAGDRADARRPAHRGVRPGPRTGDHPHVQRSRSGTDPARTARRSASADPRQRPPAEPAPRRRPQRPSPPQQLQPAHARHARLPERRGRQRAARVRPRTQEDVDAGRPEPRYTSTIHVPDNHPAGTYWYHPHLHGAIAEQIVGGMAGVVIVEGDVDEVPEIRAAADLVVCINELKPKDGRIPAFTTGNWVTGVPSVFTVNGAVNPTLQLRPGEVQRWRLVAATAFTGLGLTLTGESGSLTVHQIAQDGITFPRPVAQDRLDLAMGNRADVLVRGGSPGRYELRAESVSGPLMTIEVTGAPVDPPMALPTALPQGRPFLDESAVDTGRPDRDVVFHSDARVFPAPFPNAFRILGEGATPPADPNGDLTRDPAYGLFDPDVVNHTLPLGTVERWTVRTDETLPAHSHPFHLHTNPMLLTHRNGRRLDPPVWHDTIGLAGGAPGDSVTFLVAYEDFTGRTIAHCHQLQHEDLGMMQTVDYVEP
ncbi:multicopper oxidase domain-containing protein [Streptomyces sp. NPDC014891]|uniref:multicopper oxidase domain-containing protein n=1 Tax=Streptomyces sp. NPDC014891 TaxID=3364929 RepID=UPI003702A2E7